MSQPASTDSQAAADDLTVFTALGVLPFDHARADSVVRTVLKGKAKSPVADVWQAACRTFLAAPTDSARDHAAHVLRECHRLHFQLLTTTKSQ